MLSSSFMLFLIPAIVAVITEIIKFVLYSMKHGFDMRYSLAYGHMPSAHTAFVTSLVTTVAMYDTFSGVSFAIAFTMAIIVIFDALRLRVYMGDHARYLNTIVKELKMDESQFPRLKERVGHKPEEVAVGAVVGVLLTLFLIALGV